MTLLDRLSIANVDLVRNKSGFPNPEEASEGCPNNFAETTLLTISQVM